MVTGWAMVAGGLLPAMLTLMTRKSSRSPVGRPRAVSPQRSTNSVLAATHSLAAGGAEVKSQRAKGRRSGLGGRGRDLGGGGEGGGRGEGMGLGLGVGWDCVGFGTGICSRI